MDFERSAFLLGYVLEHLPAPYGALARADVARRALAESRWAHDETVQTELRAWPTLAAGRSWVRQPDGEAWVRWQQVIAKTADPAIDVCGELLAIRPSPTVVVALATGCSDREAALHTALAIDAAWKTAWEESHDPAWMFEIGALFGPPRTLIHAACECARRSLSEVPMGETGPRDALTAASSWSTGQATRADVRRAYDALSPYHLACTMTEEGDEKEEVDPGGFAASAAIHILTAVLALSDEGATTEGGRVTFDVAGSSASCDARWGIVGYAGQELATAMGNVAAALGRGHEDRSAAELADQVRKELPWSSLAAAVEA